MHEAPPPKNNNLVQILLQESWQDQRDTYYSLPQNRRQAARPWSPGAIQSREVILGH